jgi:transcriptional regulator with XRE-family HTH domain
MFMASDKGAQDVPRRSRPGDLGRRVASRRRELGLSVDEVSRRAGMTPAFVELVETGPAELSTGELGRLAAALATTRVELLGGHLDTAPGQATPDRRTVLVDLTEEECWSRLGHHGIGRVVFLTRGDMIVRPVNYTAADSVVLFRTQDSGVLAGAVGRRIVLEVDHPDDVLAQGWSVLVSGRAEAHPRDAAPPGTWEEEPQPWPGGTRDLLIRIRPNRITGRELRLCAAVSAENE